MHDVGTWHGRDEVTAGDHWTEEESEGSSRATNAATRSCRLHRHIRRRLNSRVLHRAEARVPSRGVLGKQEYDDVFWIFRLPQSGQGHLGLRLLGSEDDQQVVDDLRAREIEWLAGVAWSTIGPRSPVSSNLSVP